MKSATLPPAYQRKLKAILPDCLAGKWHLHGGKRIKYHQNRISVPLGVHYRVVLLEDPLRLEAVLTHESYNRIAKGKA